MRKLLDALCSPRRELSARCVNWLISSVVSRLLCHPTRRIDAVKGVAAMKIKSAVKAGFNPQPDPPGRH